MKIKKLISKLMVGAVALAIGVVALGGSASALSFGLSPMKQRVALVPGQTFYGSLRVSNPADSGEDFTFEVSKSPIVFDESSNMVIADNETYSQIVNWTTLETTGGTISPNNVAEVNFRIDVPSDAAPGAQYMAILVSSTAGGNAEGIGIQQKAQMAHVVYADVAGETYNNTLVSEVDIPSFLLNGNVSGTATVSNGGNSIADVSCVLQVFPLNSDEEYYTNEESTNNTYIIVPGATRRTTVSWPDTPMVGIYRVRLTVLVGGEQAGYAEKMVIKLPLWLLFIVIFVIAAIIIYFVAKAKARRK